MRIDSVISLGSPTDAEYGGGALTPPLIGPLRTGKSPKGLYPGGPDYFSLISVERWHWHT